jgi:hypothetical protein
MGRSRKSSADSYARNSGVPGFVYIARNEFQKSDLYKVGQTARSVHQRMRSLNADLRNAGTCTVGDFVAVYSAATKDSFGAEQLAHRILEKHRVRRHREFFEAPLATIQAAVDLAVKQADTVMASSASQERERLEREIAEQDRKRKAFAIARQALVAQTVAVRPDATSLPKSSPEISPARSEIIGASKSSFPSGPFAAVIAIFILAALLGSLQTKEPYRASQLPLSTGKPAPTTTRATSELAVQQTPPPAATPQRFAAHLSMQPLAPTAAELAAQATVRADLRAVAARAIGDYPFLDTPAGAFTMEQIIRRRDELIAQGVYPSIALTRAVAAFAPGYAPPQPPETNSAQSSPFFEPNSGK